MSTGDEALRPRSTWVETPRREATDAEARALASTARLRILRMCRGEPRTNKEIADAIGKDPATTLHHVRRLVDTGFLQPQAARRGTRSWEIPYLATGKSWRVSTPAGGRTMVDMFLDEVGQAAPDQVDTAWLGLQLSADDMTEFRQRLRSLLDDFAERPSVATQPAWSLFVSVHPDPNRPVMNDADESAAARNPTKQSAARRRTTGRVNRGAG
jgi:DNA-binding transcriptional ArsR family regulator